MVAPPLSKMFRVLMVMPEESRRAARIRQLLETMDPNLSFHIVSASDQKSACDIYSTVSPDLLLISTESRPAPGLSLFPYVRAGRSEGHTGVIFIEEFHHKQTTLSARCFELGADEVIRYGCPASEIVARIKAVLRLKAMTDELHRVNHELEALSMTDELTGLSNMRCFTRQYRLAFDHCLEGRFGLGVIMLDLDHFKMVNDSINHLMGTHVISEVGKVIRCSNSLADQDLAARYGGDEFIILCPGDTLEDTNIKADWIRHEIGTTSFERDSYTIRITSSVGVAWAPPGIRKGPDDLIQAADCMLYESKSGGRDRVSSLALTKY